MNYDIRHIFVLLRCRECETNELSPLLQMLADFFFRQLHCKDQIEAI